MAETPYVDLNVLYHFELFGSHCQVPYIIFPISLPNIGLFIHLLMSVLHKLHVSLIM